MVARFVARHATGAGGLSVLRHVLKTEQMLGNGVTTRLGLTTNKAGRGGDGRNGDAAIALFQRFPGPTFLWGTQNLPLHDRNFPVC